MTDPLTFFHNHFRLPREAILSDGCAAWHIFVSQTDIVAHVSIASDAQPAFLDLPVQVEQYGLVEEPLNTLRSLLLAARSPLKARRMDNLDL